MTLPTANTYRDSPRTHASALEAEDIRKATYKAAKGEAATLAGLIDEYSKLAASVRGIIAQIGMIDAVRRGHELAPCRAPDSDLTDQYR